MMSRLAISPYLLPDANKYGINTANATWLGDDVEPQLAIALNLCLDTNL